MTENDEFHVKERVSALHEARGKTISSRGLALYWEALSNIGREDFDAAISRAMQTGALGAHEIRNIARDVRRDRELKRESEQTFRCHAHGDGKYEPNELGDPNKPSRNATMGWCDRCAHFSRLGMQKPDTRPPHAIPMFKKHRAGEPQSVAALASQFVAREARIVASLGTDREPGEEG